MIGYSQTYAANCKQTTEDFPKFVLMEKKVKTAAMENPTERNMDHDMEARRTWFIGIIYKVPEIHNKGVPIVGFLWCSIPRFHFVCHFLLHVILRYWVVPPSPKP